MTQISGVQSTVVEKAWWQEQGTAGSMVLTVRRQRTVSAGSQYTSSFPDPGNCTAHLGHPIPINIIYIIIHRQAQSPVSMVILDSVKLAILIFTLTLGGI